jgi:exonuclease III
LNVLVATNNNVARVQPRLSYREAWDSGLPASQSSDNGPLGGAQRVGGPVDMPNNRPSSRILRQREDVRWLCMWGEPNEDVSGMWERLARVCNGGQVLRSVYKIEAVRQDNGRIRFDIYCSQACESILRQHMDRHAQRLGWYTRRHIPWESRREMAPIVSGSSGNVRMTRTEMRLGTYNINGVKSKTCDLRRFLQGQSVDCLAIQETGLTTLHRSLRLPGYHCFQVCGGGRASQRGLAIALRKGWSGHTVGTPTPWFMLVRVFGKGMGHPLIVGCVYLPHGEDRGTVKGRLILEIQQIQHLYPNDKILIMGDWNEAMPENTIVEDMGQGWGLVPQSAEIGTRHGSSRVIDFMITNSQGTFEQAKVHQQWDCSDHCPVTTVAKWQTQSASNAPTTTGGEQRKRRIQVDKVPLPKKGVPSGDDTQTVSGHC